MVLWLKRGDGRAKELVSITHDMLQLTFILKSRPELLIRLGFVDRSGKYEGLV
jgi:hypothetical protein